MTVAVSPVPSASRKRVWQGLFWAALFLQQLLLWRLYYAGNSKTLIGDENYYLETALAIVQGGPWHSSYIWPPLQSLLIAALHSLFGHTVLTVQLAQTALLFGCAGLLRGLWREFSGNSAAADAAAALFLLNPSNAAYAQYLWPEITHLFLLLSLFYLLIKWPDSWRTAALAGICLGLALLTKSLLAGFWPLFLCFFMRREKPRVLLAPMLAFGLGAFVVTAPTLISGYRDTGKPMIADSSAFNLYVGLTDRYRSDYVNDGTGLLFQEYMASGSGPVQRNRAFLEKAQTLISSRGLFSTLVGQLQRQYFRLFSAKTLLLSQFAGPPCAGYLGAYQESPPLVEQAIVLMAVGFHLITLTGFAVGVFLWRRWDSLFAWVVLLFFTYQLLLLLGLHVKARFLFPFIPFFCGFAGSALLRLGQCRVAADSLNSTVLTPLRLGLGVLFAMLLLILALLGPWLDQTCH